MEPNWNDIRYFLTLSRTRSFVSAASKLKVTHTTVSRRISALEEALQTQLFVRTEKGCRLTAAGEQLLPHAEELEHTFQQLQTHVAGRDKQLSGTIRIGTPDGLGTCFLASRLCEFQQSNPRLEVELVAAPIYYSVYKREVDILISLHRPTAERIVGKRITNYKFGLFASEAYLTSHSPIQKVADLSGHRIVGYIDDLMYDNRLRFSENVFPQLNKTFRSSTILAQLNAIKTGAGIGAIPYFMAHTEKDLRPVLPQTFFEREFWLQVNPDSRQLARVRATLDFIVDQMISHKDLFLSLPEYSS